MRENRAVKPLSGRRAGPIAVAVALVLFLCSCGAREPRAAAAGCPDPKGLTSVGETIPKECTLERISGGALSFGQLVGKPAIINFWASWCTFCIAEMPDFQKVHAALGNKVTIFVNSKGVVAFRQFGPLTDERIREILRTKLRVV